MGVEPTLASGARPGRTGPGRPRLARPVIYSNHGPKTDPACEIQIPSIVGQARSARFHLSQAVCPSWPVTFSDHFRFCLRAVAPPLRNFEATTSSLGGAQRYLRVTARYPQAVYEAESAMPYTGVRIPLAGMGCAIPYQAYFETSLKSRIVFFFPGTN